MLTVMYQRKMSNPADVHFSTRCLQTGSATESIITRRFILELDSSFSRDQKEDWSRSMTSQSPWIIASVRVLPDASPFDDDRNTGGASRLEKSRSKSSAGIHLA